MFFGLFYVVHSPIRLHNIPTLYYGAYVESM